MAQLYSRKTLSEHHLELETYVYHVGSFHYNWHEELELIAVLDGEAEVCADGRGTLLQEDDVLLINANTGHATLSRSARCTLLLLHVHPRFFMRYLPDFSRRRFSLASQEGTRNALPFRMLRGFMARILLSSLSSQPAAALDLLCAFYGLTGLCRDVFPPALTATPSLAEKQRTQKVREMLSYLETHYRERLSLWGTAQRFHYNSSYVSQLFKEHVGINFYHYLTRVRLRHAIRDLSETSLRIADVAAENGFTDLKSFNAKFREIFGRSPSDYRKSLRQEHALEDAHFKETFPDSGDPAVMAKLSRYLDGFQECLLET